MDLHFMSYEPMLFLKTNLDQFTHHYKEDTKDWLLEELGHDPLIPYKKEFPEFTLDPYDKEIHNAKKLFTALKDLSLSDATEERLWVGLSHGIFWEYMQKNTAYTLSLNPRSTFDTGFIKNRYFLNTEKNTQKRSLYIHALSKLWWAGSLTYDQENKSNPFQALWLFENAFSHKLINTFSSNFMANKTIRFALFDAGLYLNTSGIPIKGDTLVPLLKHLNELGGSVILDLYSREELAAHLIDYAKAHIHEIKSR